MNNLENEIWKNIKGYKGLYKVSNYGRVKNIKLFKHYRISKNNTMTIDYQSVHKHKQFRQNKILKYGIHELGYLYYYLSNNGTSEKIYMHRLVAQHFIPNLDNKLEVNHKDGNKQNNYVSNLEWCTRFENNKHAFENGLKNNNHFKKKVKIIKGDFSKTFDSIVNCSKYFNCHETTIGQLIKNNHKYKGYILEVI